MRVLISCLVLVAGAAQAVDLDVRVEGVDGELHDNVMLMLSLVRYRALPELNEPMIRRLHARAPGEIREALQPYGYYTPGVEPSLEAIPGGWRARYRIDPGERVVIGEVDLVITGPGADAPAFAAIRAAPGLRRGMPLRHDGYEGLKRRLRVTAANQGYLDARFTRSTLRVSVEHKTADVTLHYDTGPRYTFGRVVLEQDILDDDFVRRYVRIEEGDHYSQSELLSLQYALGDSEYFSTVEIDAHRAEAVDRAVPVTVTLRPRANHRYSAGAGYGTDTGPRGVAGWENRRVNRRGHRMSADLRLSNIKSSIGARYLIPLDDPVLERFVFSTMYVREDLGDTLSERVNLTAARTTMIGRFQHTLSSRVVYESDEVGEVTTSNTQLIPESDWVLGRRVPGVRPRNGYRANLNLQVSDPSIGAPARFLRMRVRNRAILPVGENDRVLLRAEIGTIVTDEVNRLSASQRFFAGGDASIRGYGYNRLGPRDQDGRVIGGRHLVIASVEYEHWLSGNWGVAAFVDTGNAFTGRDVDLSTGAGLGLRWQSPIGVLAIDVAHPFDDPGGRKARLHLSFGVDL